MCGGGGGGGGRGGDTGTGGGDRRGGGGGGEDAGGGAAMGCTPSIHVSQTGVVYCRESDDSNSPRPSAYSSATFHTSHTHVVRREGAVEGVPPEAPGPLGPGTFGGGGAGGGAGAGGGGAVKGKKRKGEPCSKTASTAGAAAIVGSCSGSSAAGQLDHVAKVVFRVCVCACVRACVCVCVCVCVGGLSLIHI